MVTNVTRKVGRNRGRARLWLERDCLSGAGWKRGDRFTAQFLPGTLIYERDSDGDRAVAGTAERPIIDTNTAKLTTFVGLEPGMTVAVEVTHQRIIIHEDKGVARG